VWSGGEGRRNLTEVISSVLLAVGWLIPHCARPTRALLLSFFSRGWNGCTARQHHSAKRISGGMIRKAGDGMLPEGQRLIGACGE